MSPGSSDAINIPMSGASGQGKQRSSGKPPTAGFPRADGGLFRGSLLPVSAGSLAAQASRLAAHPSLRTAPAVRHCADPIVTGPASVVLWHGRQAVLALNPATRIATVFDCRTGVHVLRTSPY
jgi:hypothetical protein